MQNGRRQTRLMSNRDRSYSIDDLPWAAVEPKLNSLGIIIGDRFNMRSNQK